MKRLLILCMIMIGMLLGKDVCAEQKKVLVIHSYHQELPWVEQCNQGIDSVLADTVVLKHVYLDTKRVPESRFQEKADTAMNVVRTFEPDVVMTGDDNALRLLGPEVSASRIPVVFFGINNNPRQYFTAIPDNVTGVIERVPLFPWIRHLADIMPGAKKALVLMDDSPTSDAIINVTFAKRKDVFLDGISVEYEVAANWTEWQRIVRAGGTYDFITVPVFHNLKTDAGVHVPVDEAIRWTSENSPVPVFAYQDYAVSDTGVVGAYVIFGEAHGRHAALMAEAILEGRAFTVPPTQMDQEGVFYFNKKQLQRFGLTLPEEIRKKAEFR